MTCRAGSDGAGAAEVACAELDESPRGPLIVGAPPPAAPAAPAAAPLGVGAVTSPAMPKKSVGASDDGARGRKQRCNGGRMGLGVAGGQAKLAREGKRQTDGRGWLVGGRSNKD